MPAVGWHWSRNAVPPHAPDNVECTADAVHGLVKDDIVFKRVGADYVIIVRVVVNVLSVTLYIKRRFGSGSDPGSLARINAVIALSGFIWFVIEIVTTLLSEKRRALHDHIAGTVVVRTEYVKKPFELQQFKESIEFEQSIPQPDRRPDRAESYSERR